MTYWFFFYDLLMAPSRRDILPKFPSVPLPKRKVQACRNRGQFSYWCTMDQTGDQIGKFFKEWWVQKREPIQRRMLFQSELKCEIFVTVISSISIWMKTDTHNKDLSRIAFFSSIKVQPYRLCLHVRFFRSLSEWYPENICFSNLLRVKWVGKFQ